MPADSAQFGGRAAGYSGRYGHGMDEPRGSIQGPVEPGGEGEKQTFAVEVGVRRVGWFERFMLMAVLIAIGTVTAIVLLPVLLLVMVGIVVYVAASLVAGLVRGGPRVEPLEDERRNVRVRGKVEG